MGSGVDQKTCLDSSKITQGNSAKEFYDYVKNESKGIHAEYVSKEEIDDETTFPNAVWHNVKNIP